MMRARLLGSLLVLSGSLARGCLPPAPAPPPAPAGSDAGPPAPLGDASPRPPADAGPATCASACANLAALRCKAGLAPNCVSTCVHVMTAQLTDLHLDDLASATTCP